MKVKEIMTASPKACTLTDNLAEAARLMWEEDCGIVPVVGEAGKLVGLITDRDICMAAMMKGQSESHIAIETVISGRLFTCKPEDDVQTALDTMGSNRVRRLPVVTAKGKLAGMLSMNDVVLNAAEAGDKEAAGLSYGDVVNTYKSICQHQLPMLKSQATAV